MGAISCMSCQLQRVVLYLMRANGFGNIDATKKFLNAFSLILDFWHVCMDMDCQVTLA